VFDTEELGVVITPDEARAFDRKDRRDGKEGVTKRPKRDTKTTKSNKSEDKPNNMPFDDIHHVEDERFEYSLNAIQPKIKSNKMLLANSVLAGKLAPVDTEPEKFYRYIELFEDPLDNPDILRFVSTPMRRRLVGMDAYDQIEIKWRAVDLQWKGNKNAAISYPAGSNLSLMKVAEYIENNTTLDVWSFEMTISSPAEELPPWVTSHFPRQFNGSREGGVMALEMVLDTKSVYRLRLIYVYALDDSNRPPFISKTRLRQLLQQAEIPEGETRLHLERRQILSTEEPHPVFEIPVTYVGRYYYSPIPPEKIEQNSLLKQLADGKLLSDLQPVFDAYDEDANKS
jgi:hypothetical protein